MKKHPAFLFIMLPIFALCSCSEGEESSSSTSSGSTPPAHVHDFSKLISNAEGHYYQCECGEHEPLEAHNFNKWVIDVQPSLSGSGSAHKECAVCHYHDATINLVDVDSEAALDSVLSAKYPAARITSSFEITKEHYVLSSLTLIATDDVTLTRASTFGGDMFVVGVNENDRTVVRDNEPVVFSVISNEKQFIIDGNRDVIYADLDHPTINVKGSAFFVSGLSTLNLDGNVKVINHKKVDNERVLNYDNETSPDKPYISKPKKVGGAAIINIDSTINIRGAVINNNESNDSTLVEESLSSYGGAIFSQGLINIYDGEFSNNVGSYGASIYTNRLFNVYKATIKDNYSYNYGAIYLGDSQYSNGHFIAANLGDITFKDNVAKSSGGALFTSTNASLLTENVLFDSNSSTSNGGAIASKGVAVLKNSKFNANSCDTKGGAVYIYYGDSADVEVGRFSKVEKCLFEQNVAGLGSALGIGNSLKIEDDPKHFATVTVSNSEFKNNHAVKNSEDKYGHGAIYVQNRCVLNMSNSLFKENTAEGYGSAMYITDESKTYLDTVEFLNNSSVGNGGAVYFYTDTYNELRNVTATENHSDNYGGFMYLSAKAIVKLFAITSLRNSAKTGGFVYITTTDTNLYIYSGSTKECTATTANSENMYGNANKAYVNIKGTDTKVYFDYDGTLITNKYTLRDILDE